VAIKSDLRSFLTSEMDAVYALKTIYKPRTAELCKTYTTAANISLSLAGGGGETMMARNC
jgi:hypothetical protein